MYIPGWDDSEGRKAGLLPRVSKRGQVCSFFPKGWVIPKSEWAGILAQPDHMRLRPSVPVILDQDGVGSCATEATAQTIMTLRSFNGQKFEKLNPWFIYYTTSGGSDRGSNIDSNLKFARDNGCAPESIWPRSKGWRARPSEEAKEAAKNYKILEFYDIRNSEELGSALLLGFPVAYGRSGHAITAVDLVTPTTMRYANSWGNWGDEGFAVESINRVNYGYGAWAIRAGIDNWSLPSIARPSELHPMMFEKYPVIEN